MVLSTIFSSQGGEARLLCLVIAEDAASIPRCQLIRVVEGVRGKVDFQLDLEIRFDYGEVRPWLRYHGEHLYSALGGSNGLLIASDVELDRSGRHDLTRQFSVRAEERIRLSIEHMTPTRLTSTQPESPKPKDLDSRLEETIRWWRGWSTQVSLEGTLEAGQKGWEMGTPMTKMQARERAEIFRRLHHGPLLILPNAWDAASAAIFAQAGFPAVATSSGAVAFAAGLPDGERLPRDEMLATLERICAAVDVPVTADLEAGYGVTAKEVEETVRLAIEAGAVGVNLEDGLRGEQPSLRPIEEQLDRLQAAREAGVRAGTRVFVNARTDVFLAGIGEPGERVRMAIERSLTYIRKGAADGAFVPGVVDPDAIRTIASSVLAPLNVFIRPGLPPVPELQRLGVRRLSLATAPMLAALGLLRRISQELLGGGSYTTLLGDSVPYPELQALFESRARAR